MEKIASDKGYCPLELSAATEKVVVDGNQRSTCNSGGHCGSTVARPVPQRWVATSGANSAFRISLYGNRRRRGGFTLPAGVRWAREERAEVRPQLISASASEGTIGREHLLQLLDIVEQSEFIYILETNGMTLGADPALCEQLARYGRASRTCLYKRCIARGVSRANRCEA